MRFSPRITEADTQLLIAEDCFESLKLLGILNRTGIPIQTSPMSERLRAESESVYKLTPLLETPSGTKELFWNIVFYFDQLFWNSQLLLSNPAALDQLFSLTEQCDHQYFPVLANKVLGLQQPRNVSDRSTSRLTHLLQWCFLSPAKKAKVALEARCEHLGIQHLSADEALQEIDRLQKETRSLPELHREVFLGATDAVLEWYQQKSKN